MLLLFSVTWGTVSGWWLLPCLLTGVLYAWLMYRKPVNLGESYRILLAIVRGLAVTVITLLLLNPLVKTVRYEPQKPLVLIAEDNSASIKTFEPKGFDLHQFHDRLASLKEKLGNDYEVREFNFDGSLHTGLSNNFNGRQTNIASAIRQLNEQFVNQNIGAVVLATDGLYNQGNDPQYEAQNLKSNIYTIPLGDNIPRRDLLISNISYNKTALLGNDFEVQVLAEANMSSGETARLNVTEDGRPVLAQSAAIDNNNWHKTFNLKLNADKKGLKKFTISFSPLKNETSTKNNTETIYVEVIDASQKVLLIYNSPHPDIAVIKQAIEINRNYELRAINVADLSKVKLSDYNLLILHQVQLSAYPTLFKFVNESKTPAWFIGGSQSNLPDFNQQQNVIHIDATRPDIQEAFALPDPSFSNFTLTDSTKNKISQFPPLLVPFGSYTASAGTSVLFKQKIGSITTTYPLLAFAEDHGRRTGVLAGEGLWRWGLSEYQNFGNHNAMNELVSQVIQYLTANSSRQRFRVYTAKNVFDEGEHVLLNAELYNEALELINTPDVKLELKNQTGKSYSYLFTRTGQSYQLNAGIIAPGDYTYTASTQLGRQTLSANGQLSVRALDLEERQSTANHQLLESLAKRSGGAVIGPSDLDRLPDLIRKNENIKTIINEDRRYSDLINIKWVFVLILALLSAEWFLRKREGEV